MANRRQIHDMLAKALLLALMCPVAGCAQSGAGLSEHSAPTYLGTDVGIDSSAEGAASVSADSAERDDETYEADDATPEIDAVSENEHILGAAQTIDQSVPVPYGTNILGVTDAGIEVYWKRVQGADGYEIARSYALNGAPERITSLSNKSFTYVDNAFDHDKRTVFYRIRTLSERDDEVAASPWSDAVEVNYAEGIELSREAWYLPSGDTYHLLACHGWGDAHDATWTSSDERVATVDDTGLVTAVSTGTAEITCSLKQEGLEATSIIEVDRGEASMLAEPRPRYEQAPDGTWRNPSARAQNDAVLVMAGDLMCMKPQQNAQYTETRGYVFNESFDYVRSVFASSDLAVGNLETMLASAYPYNRESGYLNGKPICNAPARYLDALRYAGFDLLCMANNHNADTGVRGVPMTLNQVDRYLFAHTGLFATEDDDRTIVMDVNGIKVGFVAYVDRSCSFNGQDSSWTQEQRDVLLNYYDAERASTDIAKLREKGAEYVIAYLHWGVKNYYEPGEAQMQTASELADLGVDYIVGSHPHLVQRYETLTTGDGREVPCVYSVGDFNSNINQVEGNLDSILVRIRLHRTKKGRVVLAENAYIPCHIYREYGDKRFVSMPLDETLNGGASMPDAKEFKERIARQVGDELPAYVP